MKERKFTEKTRVRYSGVLGYIIGYSGSDPMFRSDSNIILFHKGTSGCTTLFAGCDLLKEGNRYWYIEWPSHWEKLELVAGPEQMMGTLSGNINSSLSAPEFHGHTTVSTQHYMELVDKIKLLENRCKGADLVMEKDNHSNEEKYKTLCKKNEELEHTIESLYEDGQIVFDKSKKLTQENVDLTNALAVKSMSRDIRVYSAEIKRLSNTNKELQVSKDLLSGAHHMLVNKFIMASGTNKEINDGTAEEGITYLKGMKSLKDSLIQQTKDTKRDIENLQKSNNNYIKKIESLEKLVNKKSENYKESPCTHKAIISPPTEMDYDLLTSRYIDLIEKNSYLTATVEELTIKQTKLNNDALYKACYKIHSLNSEIRATEEYINDLKSCSIKHFKSIRKNHLKKK